MLFFSLRLTANATDNDIDSIANVDFVSTQDEKIICDATIEEDFEDNSVIVVFTNTKSRELKSHTKADFSEISATSVKNLTERTMNKIERQRNEKKQSVIRSESSTSSKTATIDEMYIDEDDYYQIVKVDLGINSKENVLRCIKKLEKRSDVLMAFPNYIFQPAAIPDDTLYESQWALSKISLPSAWNITTGSSSVTVGVLDTGIDITHPDLANRVNTTLSKDFTGSGSPFTDTREHGTAVAGIIGAQGNNSIGISGACWNVSLVSLKIDLTGSYYSCIVEAIAYATEKNIPILNYSYGSGDEYEKLGVALKAYKGLFVCAAGNEAVDLTDETVYMCAYWKPDSGVLGDADMSGSVTISDATYIQKYISGLVSFSDDNQILLADVNFDGSVTIADSTLIQKYTSGIVDEFGL